MEKLIRFSTKEISILFIEIEAIKEVIFETDPEIIMKIQQKMSEPEFVERMEKLLEKKLKVFD